jgi:ketosteroid isomerase-like protein
MAHPNEDLLREGYAAFGRGDLDALQNQFFAPDISWHYPGKSPFAGDCHGTGEVSGGTIRVQLNDVVAKDDVAVALTTVSAQREGRELSDDTVQVFRIRDGKATEVWSYPADPYATDAFWS